MPRRIIVGQIATAAYHGSWTQSPFNFAHFNLREASITAAGVTIPPVPYKFTFPEAPVGEKDVFFLEGYHALCDALDLMETDRSNGITKEQFAAGGDFLLAFNLVPSGTDSNAMEILRDGTIALNLLYDTAIPAGGIEVILFLEFDSCLTLDANRIPTWDYSA